MSGSQDEIPPPPPPPPSFISNTTTTILITVSNHQAVYFKKGKYDIWAMKMETLFGPTDYPIWEVIQNGNGTKDGSRTGNKEDSKALVTIDGEGVDWTNHSEEDEDYDLMACNSSDSDTEREQLSDASIEIKAYSQGLKKVEAQLVAHQQGQLCKLLNTQISANDKFGLGYGDYIYDGILSYENEVLQSVFMNKESELEKQPLYDRFVTADGMHVVPPPMTGNYMPSRPDIDVDYSQFTYGPKQTQPCESESQTSEFDTCDSNISTEPSELVSEQVVNESNVECQPKVWSDAPIIEEYESDSEDEYVSIPTKEQETPSFANQQVKTPRETVKNQFTHSQKPKVDKTELGYGFTVRACFVCGSLNHLIRDCDFHEKRMARKAELNNGWNNVQRVNKQNQFVPSAVLTRTGKIPVSTARASSTKNFSTARQSFNRQTVLTSTAMKVNTIKPIVNRVRPANVFHKTHSPSSRPFKKTTVLRTYFSNQKLNTAKDYPHRALKNKGIVDSGCSRHMTGNKAYLAEFQDFNGGPVAFGGSKGYITGKGKIKTGKLDFEDVCFVKELQHFNLFSVSQMCDKKNKVLFTDSECLVLSPEFKLPDENQVLLKIPRQNNMYSFNLENIVPSGGLACLIAKATTDESNKWHRRLGHVNFKNLNKLVKGNLVRGLPSKIFQNDHTCVACQKGKQHKASCKAKSVSSISHSLQLLHMDLFGPTSVRSLNHKTYCLVITDDFSRFSWVFFLRTKDETSGILKDFIRQIENQLNQKVKTIRCDNGTEFKNKDVIEFCGSKGIKREYSNARTPQQNGVAERKNRTLIEAAYVAEILKKFNFANVKTVSTPIETQKPLVKDEEASDVDVHLCRSMMGSLMYLTTSRPAIMFAVCACSRFQITPKSSHLSAVKRIFRYLKGKPKLGLCYPRVSSFDLESYSDSDYAGANLDRKSTTGGCQFLGRRLISWQCKKQTIVATSTTEAEYVAAASYLLSMQKLVNHRCCISKGLIEFRESLRRVIDGTEALLLPTLFILWLDEVSTDSAKLVPLGKVCTAIETLKKNTAKALISLLTTITLSTTMAVLDSCPKHNMVAYLEKSEGNAEFHEIIDFLTRSSIHHALTVSPVVSTTIVEQFWTSAKSKIINNVRHITAKVASKPVSISEASIRSDLLFDDANGIDSLPNQAIFDAIQLMGYEGDLTVLTFNKALFSPQWRFLFHTMNHCISSKSTSWDQIPTNIATAVICLTSNQKYNFSKLIFDGMLRHLDAKKKFVMYPRFISIFLDKQLANVPVPLDHFPVNALTSKVFSFMVKKGKHFSGKVTPLFASMLVQPTEDEGAPSERPSKAQPTPSPTHTSEVPIEPQTDSSPAHTSEVPIHDSIPESSGGNLGGHSSSDKSLSGNEGEMTLQSVYDLCLSLCAQILEDTPDHMETENAQDVGRTRDIVGEEKENDEIILSTEDVLSTDKEKVSTDRPIVSIDGSKVSTDRQIQGTDEQIESTDEQWKGTDDHTEEGSVTQTTQPPPTSNIDVTIFRDDETIVKVLLNMSQAKAVSREKEKGVE
ncbi:putative ribonuclease H-like domain-containing protein, partial [Tanacetum coccineum]